MTGVQTCALPICADAWEFLQQSGKYVNAPRPDLLLLDLNLPGLDGREILSRIRDDSGLQRLPVVIMTGDGDATANNGLQVEAFLTKPLDFQKFIAIVQQLSHFWQADMIVPVRVDSASEGDDFEFDV